MSDQIRMEDWEIDAETQAAVDATAANFVKFRPGPNGEEPPANVDSSSSWTHRQDEVFEVKNVILEVDENEKSGTTLVARVQFALDAGGSFNGFYRFPKATDKWNYFTKEDKARLDSLAKVAGLPRESNPAKLLTSLKGIKARGAFYQGYKERQVKDAGTGKWVGNGEFRPIQEFRKFFPLM